MTSECPGCRAPLPDSDGPTHRYIGAAPACWVIYSNLLAGVPPLPDTNTAPLVVDAYAAQHPGESSPQATQSVAIHLVTLFAILDRGHDPAEAVRFRTAGVELGRRSGHGYPKLLPVPGRWATTIADIVTANDSDRPGLVDGYVRDVLARWQDLHGELIEQWYRSTQRR